MLLAMALRDAASIEAGFAAFEAARRDRVEKIVAHGARSSSSKTPGRIGSAFRDAFMRVAFRYLITERRWPGCTTTGSTGTGPLLERLTDRGPSAMLRQPWTGLPSGSVQGRLAASPTRRCTTPGLGR